MITQQDIVNELCQLWPDGPEGVADKILALFQAEAADTTLAVRALIELYDFVCAELDPEPTQVFGYLAGWSEDDTVRLRQLWSDAKGTVVYRKALSVDSDKL